MLAISAVPALLLAVSFRRSRHCLTRPLAGVNVPGLFNLMAGFQVMINGPIWVTTEATKIWAGVGFLYPVALLRSRRSMRKSFNSCWLCDIKAVLRLPKR